VSRPHARLWLEGGECWIEDLGSRRGTQVGGDEIRGRGKRRLRAG
jgi:pSer/pThr/pTyr-binding forkhead associated (FHA) protein